MTLASSLRGAARVFARPSTSALGFRLRVGSANPREKTSKPGKRRSLPEISPVVGSGSVIRSLRNANPEYFVHAAPNEQNGELPPVASKIGEVEGTCHKTDQTGNANLAEGLVEHTPCDACLYCLKLRKPASAGL